MLNEPSDEALTARLAAAEGLAEALRADCKRLAESEIIANCENCGSWLLPDDEYVSNDDVSGCWHGMTDVPSKRERPCYAYRVGKPVASASLPSQIAATEASDPTKLLDVELEAALVSVGIGQYGPDAEQFETMFEAAMQCRAALAKWEKANV